MDNIKTAAHIALLAPVPSVHLKSALETATPGGLKAFSTKDWILFKKLEQNRKDEPVDVYIYESHPEGSFDGKATWHARYVRLEEDRHMAQPYRPKSTETDSIEGEVYWIVEDLHQMEPGRHIPFAKFVGFEKRTPYKSFPRRRPLLVQQPL